jgi:hypothetical protein
VTSVRKFIFIITTVFMSGVKEMSACPKTDCNNTDETLLSAFQVEGALCGVVETNQIWTRTFVRNQRVEYCSTDPSVLISEDLTASLGFTLLQAAAC